MARTTPGSVRRPVRAAAAALTALVLALLVLPVPAAVAADTKAQLLFVLDSSGSMQEKTADGEVKIAAAKTAMDAVVGQIPADTAVGLRVFGAKVFNRGDEGACTDSQLVVPVRTGQTKALRAAIDDYAPYGETPISYALEQAADDLGDGNGKRTIVLLSDGESTCDPDPCEVAGEITKADKNLQVDVVGLDVSGDARDQLTCVASRGRGTYYDARNSETLASSLQTLRNRAARPFEVSGEPVTGGTTPEQAAALTAGAWSDELPATGTDDVRYYDVYRETLRSTLHVAASLNRLGRPDALAVSLSTPDGTVCGTAADFRQDDAGSSILAAAVSAGQQTGKPPVAACAEATTLRLAVRRADVVDGEARYRGAGTVPVEITVTEEREVTDTDGLPRATGSEPFEPVFGENPRSTVAGSSFADAPTVEEGNYSSTLVPGETQVLLVRQTWGQHLDATLTFTQPSSTLAKKIGAQEVKANITVLSPVRGRATTSAGGGEDFLNPDGRLVLGASTTPVRFLNRAQAPERASSFVPGRYAVVVSLGADPDDQSYVVPYTLNLQVEGKKAGAPTYAPAEAAPPVPSPTPSAQPSAEAPAADDGGGGSRWVWVAGIAVVVLAAGAGLLLLRSRRR
ncbi:VWA domain-containing protein [Microlunatus capsulatus]|uniref:Ca-activated chloride channel family protein n=1 Tax=Microlunatus capsulatus TaxID=99117 RepID=A0ABS4ZA96_9ACTN|nr:VWA domain-containing protein [Microlunatus capsulatus]MBP2417904.1 Ca-activated chloride channel family protein [Microlunatus capsulatus]